MYAGSSERRTSRSREASLAAAAREALPSVLSSSLSPSSLFLSPSVLSPSSLFFSPSVLSPSVFFSSDCCSSSGCCSSSVFPLFSLGSVFPLCSLFPLFFAAPVPSADPGADASAPADPFAAVSMRRASAGSTSARSSFPAARADARSSRGTAVRTISDSFAGRPHQRGLRARVTVLALRSTFWSANGPAVTFSLRRAPSLNASGVPMTSLGYSGENSERQSA